jgi:hypothetical protein
LVLATLRDAGGCLPAPDCFPTSWEVDPADRARIIYPTLWELVDDGLVEVDGTSRPMRVSLTERGSSSANALDPAVTDPPLTIPAALHVDDGRDFTDVARTLQRVVGDGLEQGGANPWQRRLTSEVLIALRDGLRSLWADTA